MLTKRWLIAACPLLLGCTGALPAEQQGGVTVVVVMDSSAVKIVDVQPAGPAPAGHGSALRWALVNPQDEVLAEGLLADPRQRRAELFDAAATGPLPAQAAVAAIQIPPLEGELVLLERALSGWREVGRDHFDPRARWSQLLKASDVLGPPVLVAGQEKVSLSLVLMPEGYTEAELTTFHQDVTALVSSFKTQPDFAAHRDQISFYRVDVRSRESGIDDPQQALSRDTAFDVSFGSGSASDPRRLAYPRTIEGSQQAILLAKQVPNGIPVILINSDDWCGAGGSTVVFSRGVVGGKSYGAAILAHELSHLVLALADEYETGACSQLPGAAPNLSTSPLRDALPWKDLVALDTPLPTAIATPPPTTLDPVAPPAPRVGAYEGGGYCEKGVWRPEPGCLMREVTTPMCAVCRRELERYFLKRQPEQTAPAPSTP
jgi:hypothetical protein